MKKQHTSGYVSQASKDVEVPCVEGWLKLQGCIMGIYRASIIHLNHLVW